MKTTLHFLAFFASALVLVSCDTEIPLEDNSSPEFSFRIYGDGFDRTFDQDTDFESFQLNLKDGKVYDFVFSAGDPGGVELTQMQISAGLNLPLQTKVPKTWTHRPGYETFIEWRGSRSRPVTGAILTGKFRAIGNNAGVSIRFFISGFGSQRGPRNSTSEELYVYLKDQPTGISPL